jgi:glycosyltransferase involved in cell wall biosynthesis
MTERHQPLRLAMVAPPYYSIPPDGYGGIEVVVADLVDSLVPMGHHVTLVCAGSHGTLAQDYVPVIEEPEPWALGEALPEIVHAAQVLRAVERLDVDLVHDHTAAGPLLAPGRPLPTVVTAHGPVTSGLGDMYAALGSSISLVALSDAQRTTRPDLPWVATVHNGVHVDTFPYRVDKEDWVLFLGRFHPEKAPHAAIDAARAAGVKIVLAGKCSEPIEKAYFAEMVEPRLGPGVELFGIADARAKRDLLSRARCLVFPICWDEPFGLVMVEALACGTPVVALRSGAVPEIVEDGVTGLICDKEDELAEAIEDSASLLATDCRLAAERRFDVSVMAKGYERVYREVLASQA